VTGNKNANFTERGELGMLMKAYEEAHDLATKNWSGAQSTALDFALSHTVPAGHALLDTFLGKNVETGTTNSSISSKVNQAKNDLFAPGTYMSKMTAGKQSPWQALAAEYFGVNTPNASCAPKSGIAPNYAAPNFKNIPLLKSFNAPGSVTAAPVRGIDGKLITDPTGYKQEQNYYAVQTAIQNRLDNPQNMTSYNAYKNFLTYDKNTNGQAQELTPSGDQTRWTGVKEDPKALTALQQIKLTNGNPEPVWKLTGNGIIINAQGQQSYAPKLQVYAIYQSELNGSGDRSQLEALNPWLTTVDTANQNWINQNIKSGSMAPYAASSLPLGITAKDLQYPTLTSEQNSLMNLVSSITAIPAADRTSLQSAQLTDAENNPVLQQAYNALDTYSNYMRAAKGASPINYGPNEPPAVAEGYQSYDDWKNAGGKASAWINAHPALWAQMSNYSAQSDLAENAKAGAETELEGAVTPANNTQLSTAYNLGQYDIAKTTGANGGNSYTLNPAAAYAQSSSGSSYSSTPSIVKPPVPSDASNTKLINALKGAKSIKSKKVAGKASKSYHVKRVSLGKTQKAVKPPAPKKPDYITSNGLARYEFWCTLKKGNKDDFK